MFLSSIGLLPEKLEFMGSSAIPSFLAGSPPFHPEDALSSEDEEEQRIEFLAGHEIRLGDRTRRIVLMTYDDQGHRTWIDRILDAYTLVGGKASFFFTGNCLPLYAERIQRIVAEGHVFGSHGLVHELHTAMRSDEIRAQLREWLGMVDEIIPGYQVKFFRFPYGDRNERVKKVIAEFGLQSVHWNIESGGLDEDTFDKVVGKVFNGSIVLSHMTRYYDVHEAERILKHLIKEGYALESLETGMDPKDLYPQVTLNEGSFTSKPFLKYLQP
ncbi:MAG: hypothetical protein A2Z14_07885 [Chloroflexi bacterium RBG_16_48_8]|nr:MAG: hypothetical protein A2Z14_07885 [Chloroflexi bacterium RBG_16_48_8]